MDATRQPSIGAGKQTAPALPAWLTAVHEFLKSPNVQRVPFGVGTVAGVATAAVNSYVTYVEQKREEANKNVMIFGKSSLAPDAPIPEDIMLTQRENAKRQDVAIPKEVLRTLAGRSPLAQAAMVEFLQDSALSNNEANLVRSMDYLNTQLDPDGHNLEHDERKQSR